LVPFEYGNTSRTGPAVRSRAHRRTPNRFPSKSRPSRANSCRSGLAAALLNRAISRAGHRGTGARAMSRIERVAEGTVEAARKRAESLRGRAEQTLLWKVWERLLEVEFVDRSVALAGKAFVSFFPLIIVVAAFMPSGLRTSIISTVVHRFGLTG